ncbi:hypothetical protein T31B1_08128 [Salinisphaera sp. T31B1]
MEPAERPRAALDDWPAWPTYGLVDDLLPILERWADAGRRVAIATLVDIRGSSPRPLGSEMAISDAGQVAGYVSGGCVEAAVATQALEVLATGRPVMLDYGAGSPVLDVQLTCGGRIGIFVRAIADIEAYAARLREARRARQTLDVRIDLESGAHRFQPAGPDIGQGGFTKRYRPVPRLVVVGSDPVTLALCQAAPLFGYEVVLLRPYGPTAPPPETRLCHYDTRPLARALDALKLDASSAVYTLTHDMDDDHTVLCRALASPAFCVGALGSRHKADERAQRLRAEGYGDTDLARLDTPAGLDIGAREPREIALSMLAALVERCPRETAFA